MLHALEQRLPSRMETPTRKAPSVAIGQGGLKPTPPRPRAFHQWLRGGGIVLLLSAMYAEVLLALFREWWTNPDYSHGLLVVPLALYVFWTRRPEVHPVADRRGLVLTLTGCIFYLAGTLAAEFFLARFSFVVLLAGLLWTFFGLPHLRRAVLPLLLVVTVIPLPAIVYNRLSIPLQLFASGISARLLDMAGVALLQNGNIIELAHLRIGVAEACSGLRSMSTLIVLALFVSYFQAYTPRLSAVVALLAIPIAIIVNLVRIVGTALLVEFFDKDLAVGFYHSFTGWLVFLGGAALLLAASALLSRFAEQTGGPPQTL